MTVRLVLRRGTYFDSVALMLASRDAERVEGVDFAAAIAATPVNLSLLRDEGFELPDDLGPNDLIVAIRASDEDAATAAERTVEERLSDRAVGGSVESADMAPRSIRSAARRNPDINVAFISVPGRFAAYEVGEALAEGLHVFCFSDGMSLADEAALKRYAVDKELLFLGADCGTAIVDGVGYGFANVVGAGPVGIVGASGTGIQQVMCLLDAAGIGISHALGVGGRDLSAEVGGLMATHCLELLGKDPSTEVIVVVSKPPDRAVAERLAGAAVRAGKRVILGFLSSDGDARILAAPEGVEIVQSLEEAAARAAQFVGARIETHDADPPSRATPGRIRGLFCGGSLCFEAAATAGEGDFIDFGDDEYTTGRAHPMIDPILRNEHFIRAAADPHTGAVVADVVLGLGAHPSPGDELAPLIDSALSARHHLSVVVALCGTDRDPQGLARQRDRLVEAGALVTRNAAHAGRLARAATHGTS